MEPMIDAKLVKQRIAERADDFIETLFGDGAKRDGADKWRIGGRGSLAVTVKDCELVFYSHEDGAGSDAIALWQRERGGSAGDAFSSVRELGGRGRHKQRTADGTTGPRRNEGTRRARNSTSTAATHGARPRGSDSGSG